MLWSQHNSNQTTIEALAVREISALTSPPVDSAIIDIMRCRGYGALTTSLFIAAEEVTANNADLDMGISNCGASMLLGYRTVLKAAKMTSSPVNCSNSTFQRRDNVIRFPSLFGSLVWTTARTTTSLLNSGSSCSCDASENDQIFLLVMTTPSKHISANSTLNEFPTPRPRPTHTTCHIME
ncbi:hypothetical protein HPB50_024857 [Hyalomma asiaticum]|uniref:Uncharacterized protein n=1 Tax=Hyalomma asiaticum TaxID=266040 RepID=A0ACB7TNB9_HYAAI|nr:hypothetical protein HPB50_024857 [Hyalomma asiaticum]